MKTAKRIMAGVVLLMAASAEAMSVNITLWRGETATKILHDYATVGAAPEGFEVKVGTAKEVRYLTRPFGTHYASFADKADFQKLRNKTLELVNRK